MIHTIIEDCSPFYIRFTYEGLGDFCEYARQIYSNINWSDETKLLTDKEFDAFHFRTLPNQTGQEVLTKTQLDAKLNLNPQRVSYFVSDPGLAYRAHKDGLNVKFGINYTLKVLDDLCVTNWYSDQDLKRYKLDLRLLRPNTVSGLQKTKLARECVNFDKTQHTPLKSMVAKPNECILFNTDIYHSWDNSKSTNERIILTFRPSSSDSLTFLDAKEILFQNS